MATFDQIFRKNRYNIRDAVGKSSRWFEQQIRMLSQKEIRPNRLITSNAEFNVPNVIPGEMYLFQYDAKYKDVLPMWDMFPLVFPFNMTNNGFIGLNMHYLPYPIRIRLLDALLEHRTNNTLDSNTRLKISWSLIQSTSKFKVAEPAVHRYIRSHVVSPFKKIESMNWATAMMLPVERFVGGTKQQAWRG